MSRQCVGAGLLRRPGRRRARPRTRRPAATSWPRSASAGRPRRARRRTTCRVVTLRTGIVLAADGGALPRMVAAVQAVRRRPVRIGPPVHVVDSPRRLGGHRASRHRRPARARTGESRLPGAGPQPRVRRGARSRAAPAQLDPRRPASPSAWRWARWRSRCCSPAPGWSRQPRCPAGTDSCTRRSAPPSRPCCDRGRDGLSYRLRFDHSSVIPRTSAASDYNTVTRKPPDR